MSNFKYHSKRYILAIFFILLIVFFLLYRQGFFENKALKSALYWEKQGKVRVADSLKKVAPATKITEETSPDSVIRIKAEKPDARDVNIYYLIIGSFINKENANQVARQYRRQGYYTSIISTTNSNGNKAELVSVKTFGNYDEAVRYLREFQSKVDPKAWLYPNQKTKLP
jgi:hypothetical protein